MSRDLEQLRRWEGAGGTWQVLARGSDWVDLALLPCTGGDEMDRLNSTDPAVLEYVRSTEAEAHRRPDADADADAQGLPDA